MSNFILIYSLNTMLWRIGQAIAFHRK